MEKPQNMHGEDTSLYCTVLWFGPAGKIKNEYISAEYAVIPKKGVCCSKCQSQTLRTYKFLLWFEFVPIDCKLLCQYMSQVFSPLSVLFRTGLDMCILLICDVESPVSFHYGDHRSVFYLPVSISAPAKMYFSEQDYSCFYLKHSW